MLISLDDVLAARDELGQGPCAEGIAWFKEQYPDGLEVRHGLAVVPPGKDDRVEYFRWPLEALGLEIQVVLYVSGTGEGSGYLMLPGGIGKRCDYEEYRRRYEGEI